MTRYFMTAAAISALLPALAHADAATEMCMTQMKKSEAQCACATEALVQEVGAEEVAIYNRVGALFLDNMEAGQEMAPAWDAAVKVVGGEIGMSYIDLIARMNPVGRANRNAVKACE